MEFSINIKLKIGDNLLTNHSTGLFESSRLVLWLPSPDEKIRKTNEEHQNIKILAVPILCYAYAQLN